MLRFVVGFAAGWIAKKWLDEEIDKNKGTLQGQMGDYGYMDALGDKWYHIKRKLEMNFNSKCEE